MTGTLVNAAAIAAGGCVGLLLKKGVKGSHQDSINKALGVAVLVLGLNGVISSMFTVNADGTLASSGELLLIISLVLGTLAGEALRIDDRLNGLSGLVERRLHLSGFAQSFVNGALIYCVGAMAIIGALNDGLRGDASVLYIKSLLDGISSVVLGATLGPGVIFAALPVLVYQGAISLLAGALEPFLAGELLGQICGVGYCLVLCIGMVPSAFAAQEDNYHNPAENWIEALNRTNGKISGQDGAAELLGLNPSTLWSKIRKYRIDVKGLERE